MTGTDLGSKKGKIIHRVCPRLMEKVLGLLSALCILLWQTSKMWSARQQAPGSVENRKKMLWDGKQNGKIRFSNWSCTINKPHLHFRRLLFHEMPRTSVYPAVFFRPSQCYSASSSSTSNCISRDLLKNFWKITPAFGPRWHSACIQQTLSSSCAITILSNYVVLQLCVHQRDWYNMYLPARTGLDPRTPSGTSGFGDDRVLEALANNCTKPHQLRRRFVTLLPGWVTDPVVFTNR